MKKRFLYQGLVLLFLLIVLFVLYALEFGNIAQAIYLTVLYATVIIFSINAFLLGYHENNEVLKAGSITLLGSGLLNIILSLTTGYISEEYFSILIWSSTWVSLVGSILVTFGMIRQHLNNQVRKDFMSLFEQFNETVYFDINVKDESLNLYFSDAFVKKHKLTYTHLHMSMIDWWKLVCADDKPRIQTFYNQAKNNIMDEVKFRIKYPEMDDECWVFCKISRSSEYHFLGIAIEVTSIQKLNDMFEKTSKELRDKLIEEQYVLDHTKELIARIDLTGEILYLTPSFTSVYPLTIDEMMGKNISYINELVGIYDHSWVEITVLKSMTSGLSKYEKEGVTRWISWHNEVVYDSQSNPEYIICIGHDVTEMQLLNEKLSYENTHDSLTKLYNRLGLYQWMEQVNMSQTYAVYYLDIESFSTVNEYYGNHVGDQIMIQMASKLSSISSNQVLCARISGDEFVIVREIEQMEEARDFGRYLISLLHQSYKVEEISITMDVNVGYAIYPSDASSLSTVLSMANTALVSVKKNRSLRVVRFDTSMNEQLMYQVIMEKDIRDGIEHAEIDVFFQDILDVKHHEVAFIEALARWNHKDLGWISPKTLFEFASKTGLVMDLDLYLIEKAMTQFSSLQHEERFNRSVCNVNVTPPLLLNENLPNRLLELTNRLSIDPNRICIEISESMFVHSEDLYLHQLNTLKNMGFLIAIDDFGNEYSSLSVLDQVPFDILKIDKLFINKIDSLFHKEIMNTLIKVSRSSDKIIIAEGIETELQSELLLSLGCHYHQGYLYSRPRKLIDN